MTERASSSAVRLDETSVAVVIPVYNGRETIGRALESAKAQTCPPDEIAVVDDGSTDGTREFVQNRFPDVSLVTHRTNRGGSAARNSGVESTSSELIAYLDADDEWMDHYLECQVGALQKSVETTAGIYCGFNRKRTAVDELVVTLWQSVFPEPTIRNNPPGDRQLIPQILSGSFYFGGASTLVVSRSSHEKLGGWDESFERHQDWQYVLDLILEGYNLGRCPEKLVLKHETGAPAGEAVERASARLLSKYEDQVHAAEKRGFDVEEAHVWSIATAYFRAGDFRQGGRWLRKARNPTVSRLAHLVYALWQGLRMSPFK